MKEANDVYMESINIFKIMKKWVNGKTSCAHELEDLILLICLYYLKQMKCHLCKNLSNNFIENRILKFMQRSEMPKTKQKKTPLEKNKAGVLTYPRLKT